MEEKTVVKIRGKEYSIIGDDISAIEYAAQQLDNELKQLEKSYVNKTSETLAILAALNFAEMHFKFEKKHINEENYLINELDKMTNFLNELSGKVI